MNPGEYRVGNIISTGDFVDDYGIVQSIDIDDKGVYWFKGVGAFKSDWQWIANEVEPVDLNEEWLVSFGFDHARFFIGEDDIDRYTLNGFVVRISSINELTMDYNGLGLSFPEYVHHFQNLYYALTGEELDIKFNGR